MIMDTLTTTHAPPRTKSRTEAARRRVAARKRAARAARSRRRTRSGPRRTARTTRSPTPSRNLAASPTSTPSRSDRRRRHSHRRAHLASSRLLYVPVQFKPSYAPPTDVRLTHLEHLLQLDPLPLHRWLDLLGESGPVAERDGLHARHFDDPVDAVLSHCQLG